MNEELTAGINGYVKKFDFTQYSHDNNVNCIPEEDFKHLVMETFKCIADILRNTYGPYASSVLISEQAETFATKDGYNVFNALGFSHTYKRLVYLAIKKIIERVNDNVGDGTTSCILLAEKIFNELENILHTVDDKRNILNVLNKIEKYLLNRTYIDTDIKDGYVKPLNGESLSGIISMASNYDETITSIINEALAPEVDDEGNIVSIRNVVTESKLDHDVNYTEFEVDHLPGDYRVRVNMDSEFAMLFENPMSIRVALYDHVFGPSDWNFFMQKYDKKTMTLILARSFSKSFMDHEYTQYARNLAQLHAPMTLILGEIKGNFVRDEINDLAAVLGTKAIGQQSIAVDHDSLPVRDVQVYKGNCMCFNMPEIPYDYIEELKYQEATDLSKSMIRHQLFKERIAALSKVTNDSMITVRSNTSLELKLISDKIEDCIAIVNSAMNYGIVPNLFTYGYRRMECYTKMHLVKDSEDDDVALDNDAATAIMNSIHGLFNDIWASKHGDQMEPKRDAIFESLHGTDEMCSFDIMKESIVDAQEFPTSAQYDLEVIAAAISIVKYLITSKALVFDACIMRPVDDTGTYTPL